MTVEAPVLLQKTPQSYFLPHQLSTLDKSRIPNHIAIIPDGNRRWAKKRLTSTQDGHREGADILLDVVKAAKELQVKVMTVYTFSTENWIRSDEEVMGLLMLIASYLIQQRDEMVDCGIKLDTIGDLEKLPSFLTEVIAETKEITKNCDKITLVLAINYGARNEMCRAFKKVLQDYKNNQLNDCDIDENLFPQYLDTAAWPDPELLIRTSGELRVSNFLLWQISYTEIHIAPVLWPDFTPEHLLQGILEYQHRTRRWGI